MQTYKHTKNKKMTKPVNRIKIITTIIDNYLLQRINTTIQHQTSFTVPVSILSKLDGHITGSIDSNCFQWKARIERVSSASRQK